MKYITLILLVITIIGCVGCETTNPLCTENFCVEGEIYAKSELAEDMEYGKLPIDDATIFAMLTQTTTPIETTPAEETDVAPIASDVSITPLALIVADVLVNDVNSTYKDQTVTLSETVKFNFVERENQGGITLTTNSDSVIFYITDFDTPETLSDYAEGETYTFNVYIRNILESPTTAGVWFVYSHEVEE